MVKSGLRELKIKMIVDSIDSVDSVDSVEYVDKTTSILRVYREYPAGICGVWWAEEVGSGELEVVGCQVSVVRCRLSGRILMELNKKRLKA